MKLKVVLAASAAALLSHAAFADQFNNLGLSYGLGGGHQQGTVEFNKTVLPHMYVGATAGYRQDRHDSNSYDSTLGLHVGGFMPLGSMGMQGYAQAGYTTVTNHGALQTTDGSQLNFIQTEAGVTGPLNKSLFYKVYGGYDLNTSSGNTVDYRTTMGAEVGYMVLSNLSVNLGMKHQDTAYANNTPSAQEDMAYLKTQFMF